MKPSVMTSTDGGVGGGGKGLILKICLNEFITRNIII